MMICLLWGYLAASIAAFFVYYAACIVAASADQLHLHRQQRFVDPLTIYQSL